MPLARCACGIRFADVPNASPRVQKCTHERSGDLRRSLSSEARRQNGPALARPSVWGWFADRATDGNAPSPSASLTPRAKQKLHDAKGGLNPNSPLVRLLRSARNVKAPSARERERVRASEAVRKAVRRGALTKPANCEDCLEEMAPRDLHGHHEDYSQRLSVRWLCRRCHIALHAARRHEATEC